MSREVISFPPNGQEFYKIRLKPEALTCATQEEFQEFGKSVKAFCETADVSVCTEMAESGLCARMETYLFPPVKQRRSTIIDVAKQPRLPSLINREIQPPRPRSVFTLDPKSFDPERRPSSKEVAIDTGRSIGTARRALQRLVEAGLLPLHPRDPRTVDQSGLTKHSRNLDETIRGLLEQNPKLKNRELVELLADPTQLSIHLSTGTIERSRLRLAEAGKAEKRILASDSYRELDSRVEVLLGTGITYKEIAKEVGQPLKRVRSSGYRLRKAGRAASRALPSDTKKSSGLFRSTYR